jgi:response regulator RpfG family c-di-GMP phosphodiesterase
MRNGLILLIEDDHDDKDLLVDIMQELNVKNKIVWFDNCEDAYNFISETRESIYIIFSDINLPKKTGLELKSDIDRDPVLKRKSIPFIFYSTSADGNDIDEAYSNLNVQGFFKKESDYNEVKCNIKTILDYWAIARKPYF